MSLLMETDLHATFLYLLLKDFRSIKQPALSFVFIFPCKSGVLVISGFTLRNPKLRKPINSLLHFIHDRIVQIVPALVSNVKSEGPDQPAQLIMTIYFLPTYSEHTRTLIRAAGNKCPAQTGRIRKLSWAIIARVLQMGSFRVLHISIGHGLYLYRKLTNSKVTLVIKVTISYEKLIRLCISHLLKVPRN